MHEIRTVAVVGGGVIGASCALALAKEGFAVSVLDEGPIGYGCSFGNGAQYNIGSALPMAYPGVIKQGIRWLGDAEGPVRISLGQLPKNIAWFMDFFATSLPQRWSSTYKALHALNSPCALLYREMLGPNDWKRIFRPNGALHVWRSPAPGRLDAQVAGLREALGVPFEVVNSQRIRELEPLLASEYQRGIFFPGSGHVVSSVGLVEGLMAKAASFGTTYENCKVRGITQHGAVASLHTDSGARKYDAVVVAAGFASKALAKQLGISLTMTSERGYHVTLTETMQGVSRPVTDAESAVVATPLAEGLRLVGIAEFDAADAAPNDRQPDKLLALAKRLFPSVNTAGNVSRWMGVRPSMPDSLPVIDRHPQIKNLFFATGHGHMGISGAPMTAALISDLVVGREPRISTARYCIR